MHFTGTQLFVSPNISKLPFPMKKNGEIHNVLIWMIYNWFKTIEWRLPYVLALGSHLLVHISSMSPNIYKTWCGANASVEAHLTFDISQLLFCSSHLPTNIGKRKYRGCQYQHPKLSCFSRIQLFLFINCQTFGKHCKKEWKIWHTFYMLLPSQERREMSIWKGGILKVFNCTIDLLKT